MIIDLQHFVPLRAFGIQLLFFLLGMAWLLRSRAPWSLPMRVAAAYPVGAGFAGLIQWFCFMGGRAGLAPSVLALFVLFTVLRIILVPFPKQEMPGMRRDWVWWALLAAIGLTVITAFLITQSSDLHGTNPRWQWGYRGKIMAGEEGYGTPLFRLPDAFHWNRKYPLAYTGILGLTLRLMGDFTADSAMRTVSWGYFCSFLLLLLAYAADYDNGRGTLIALLAFLVIPKAWGLGLDENYVDFPLGVTALCWLMLMSTPEKHSLTLETVVLSIMMVGMKMEGLVLLSVLILVYAWRLVRAELGRKLVGYVFPAGVTLCVGIALYMVSLHQLPHNVLYMENVQYGDISWSMLARNLGRAPVVLRAFAWEHPFRIQRMGLFIPLAILCLGVARGPFRFLIAATTVMYLAAMTIPFVFSPYTPIEQHLNVVVTRLLFQTVPLLCILVAEAVGELDCVPWRMGVKRC